MNKDTLLGIVYGAYGAVVIGLGLYLARQALDRRFQTLGYQITGAQYLQRFPLQQPVPTPAEQS